MKPQEFCKATDNTVIPSRLIQSLTTTKTRSPGKVLIVNKTSYSKGYKAVTEILSAHRIGYKSTVAGKNLPDLIKVTRNVGKYGVIVFEDFRTYINMDPWNRDLLDKYCKNYNVGIIAFVPIEDQLEQLVDKSKKMSNLPRLQMTSSMKNIEVKSNASILRLAKSGTVITSGESIWMTFQANNRSS